MKYLFIDYQNIVYKKLHTIKESELEDNDYNVYKGKLLSNILRLISQFPHRKVILACEGGNSWRKDLFPEYKAQRASNRAKDKIDYEKFFKMLDKFTEELKDLLCNCIFVKYNRIEGDDIIAILTKHLCERGDSVVNVSTDGDFLQLCKYDNYEQWNPVQAKYMSVIDPKLYLIEKTIFGDKSDNIPHIRHGIGKVTAKNLACKTDFHEWLIEENLQDNFDKNYKLIAFDAIPIEIEKNILDTYNNYKPKTINMISKLIEMNLGYMMGDLAALNLVDNAEDHI